MISLFSVVTIGGVVWTILFVLFVSYIVVFRVLDPKPSKEVLDYMREANRKAKNEGKEPLYDLEKIGYEN